MLRLSDENKAFALVLAIIALSVVARVTSKPAALDFGAGEQLDLDSLAEATRVAIAREARAARPLAPGERVDPNRATAEDLERLPGVGTTLAARIVAAREHAPFASVEDLTRVSGIGPAMLDRLRPHVEIGGGGKWRTAGPGTGTVSGRRPAVPSGPGNGPGPDAVPRLLDVNTASLEELDRLPGIGPALARQIVAFRDSAGPIRRWPDLERVPGIGPAKLARLRPYVRLNP